MNRRILAGLCTGIFLAGCGADKEADSAEDATGGGVGSDGDDTDDTDDSGPLTHESDFALLEDDAPIYARVNSAASYHLDVAETGVSGFVTYTETTDEGSETCAAVLSIHTTDESVDCGECDWGVGARSDLAVQSGTCVLADASTGLTHARELSSGGFGLQLSHYTDATVGGSTYSEAVTVGVFDNISSALEEWVVYGAGGDGSYEAASGSLTGDLSATTDYTLGWLDCGGAPVGASGNLTPGELSLSEDLSCGSPDEFGTHTVDHWTRELQFGQVATVGIRSQSSDVDLYLRSPDGCRVVEAPPAEPCPDDATNWCKSLEYTITTGGSYTALVALTGCTESVNYQFDARVRSAR